MTYLRLRQTLASIPRTCSLMRTRVRLRVQTGNNVSRRIGAVMMTGLLASLTTIYSTPSIAEQATNKAERVVIGAPNSSATSCTDTDFGAVQIRIGLHATLAACYREVQLEDRFGTAFATVPREFENRIISNAEFDAFRAEVHRSEEQFKQRARDTEPDNDQRATDSRPIPLGVFDNTSSRIGYAYAYAVNERSTNGDVIPQTMMRTESFVLVNGHVILLMIIAPVDDGKAASVTFDLSERWAKAIVAASKPAARAAAPRASKAN